MKSTCLQAPADGVSRELHPPGEGQTCSSLLLEPVLLSAQRQLWGQRRWGRCQLLGPSLRLQQKSSASRWGCISLPGEDVVPRLLPSGRASPLCRRWLVNQRGRGWPGHGTKAASAARAFWLSSPRQDHCSRDAGAEAPCKPLPC